MESILGSTWPVFIGFTLVLMGGAAWATGRALARNWRPQGQIVPYALLLGCGDRFLVYGLFDGSLSSVSGYLIDAVLLMTIVWAAFRMTTAAKMVDQYPWLYQRQGVFGWRSKEEQIG